MVGSRGDVNEVCFMKGRGIMLVGLEGDVKFVEEMVVEGGMGEKVYEDVIDGLVNECEDEGGGKDVEGVGVGCWG